MMRECWINVYYFNIMGLCWNSRLDAIAQIDINGVRPLYRIHVRLK